MKRFFCALFAALFALTGLSWSVSLADEAAVDIHTPEQAGFISESYDDLNAIYDYADGSEENSLPAPIVCDFSGDGIPDSPSYVFQWGTRADFAGCVTDEYVFYKTYDLYNVLLGEHVYWRAGTSAETVADSPVHELTVTSQAPRVCFVPGVYNVRDVGGWPSSLAEGAYIRQGLYYRGKALDGINADGEHELYDVLGVRAEIDLRDRSQCKGPYVDGVDYHAIPIPSGTESTRFEKFAKEYVKIYDVIANAAEKPVYLHCSMGADRTGIATFMLLTVCGVSYEDAARDYLFTCFAEGGMRHLASEFEVWEEKLGALEGETRAEKAKSWMTSKGVPEATVEKIRETFVAGYKSDVPTEFGAGDVNRDAKIDALDAVMIMKYLVGYAHDGFDASLADVDGSGRINARDVIAVMMMIVNKE